MNNNTSTVVSAAPAIHVRVWRGGSVRITDMLNAGKRGKVCRTVHFGGWMPYGSDPVSTASADLAHNVMAWADALPTSTTFDDATAALQKMVADAALPVHCASVTFDDVRGIDAPRPTLSARVAGKFSAIVDEHGISLHDEVDQHNEPAMITFGQTSAQAYRLAAKVWDKVAAAASFHDAGEVLRAAGCKLHYYCRMD
jgi:hypothetical protein